MSAFSTLAIIFAFGLVISGIAYLGIMEAQLAAERMVAKPPVGKPANGTMISLADARSARAARMESTSGQKIAS